MHKYANDHIKFALAASARLAADLQKIREPNAVLAASACLAADLQPSAVLAASARLAADLQKIREPSAVLAASACLAADLQPSAVLAASARVAATSEQVQEHRNNYVEPNYNRDLAYPSTEESNHAIEDYKKVVISALELGKNPFGNELAFSAGNQEISSNTPYIGQMNITFNIGHLTQGENIKMKSEISHSQVGVLNTGKMQAKSITASISTTAASNPREIVEALKNLTEAVKASQDISSQQRIEILEQLELLSEQVILAPSERKVGLIKPTLSALTTALSAGGGAAEIWSQWGDVIKNFFGIHD